MNARQKEIIHLLTINQHGLTASDVAKHLHIDRSNASRYLSDLYKERQIMKTAGRPVVYSMSKEAKEEVHVDSSTQAKAAILYPPRGLHTIIFGETGTGKSMFAECMYHFAMDA